jgi:mono/diheme cytochrome c family protein
MICVVPNHSHHRHEVVGLVASSSGHRPGRIFPCLFVSLSLLLAGCDFPGRPKPADRPVPANDVLDFGVLYGQNCAGCHGADGKLGPAPPLNDGLFRAIVPQEELESIVSNGRSKTLMPAFGKENGGTLTAAQIQVLVHEIKGIPYSTKKKESGDPSAIEVVADSSGRAPKWGPAGNLPANVPPYNHLSINASSSSTGDIVKGAAVFVRACAVCHGDNGRGLAEGKATKNAINDPVFLALNSDQVLRRYAITGRSDFGMPGFAEARPGDSQFQPLSDQEIADLVALLASWRQTTVAGN